MIVTGSLLIAGLAAGLSGNRLLYRFVNFLTGAALPALCILIIWRSDHNDSFVQPDIFAPAISRLPILLTAVLILKFALAGFTWNRAIQRGLTSSHSAACYFAGWLLAVGTLELMAFILYRESGLLRQILMLMAALIVPLGGSGARDARVRRQPQQFLKQSAPTTLCSGAAGRRPTISGARKGQGDRFKVLD